MNSNNHIDPEDLALFALQLLSAEDAASMQQHLNHCEACRRELAAVQGDLAIFAMTTEVHSPPARARERFLAGIAREPRSASATAVSLEQAAPGATASSSESAGTNAASSPLQESSSGTVIPIAAGRREGAGGEREIRGSSGRVLPWLGWAAAAGLAFTSFHFYRERQVLQHEVETTSQRASDLELQASNARRVQETLADASAVRVTLTRSKQAPQPQGKATYVADKGSLIFIASNLEPLQPYKTYELWIIPANGHDPIAAGTFHPDPSGNASVIMPDLPKGVVAKAFGVTIEDEGGSRAPTMPIILSGAAAGA